jgi:N-acetylmuramoyl-L-alanine amidase
MKFKSPNFDCRPHGVTIDTLVLHHTNMKDADAALQRLCNPAAKVSCHYLITKHAEVIQLVEERYRAWHAGLSCWHGREAVNDFSLGIELDNSGNEPFPTKQIDALIVLCKEIFARHCIVNVVSHAEIAPMRKDDPNYLFPWNTLAINGIGKFPTDSYDSNPYQLKWHYGDKSPEITKLQEKLLKYGFCLNVTGEFDLMTKQVVMAFNRRFNPRSFIQGSAECWSSEAEEALEFLLKNS